MYKQMIQVSARERVNSHVHLPVSSACTLYVAPEDGCVLLPKHVEQKFNKITLKICITLVLIKPYIMMHGNTKIKFKKKN